MRKNRGSTKRTTRKNTNMKRNMKGNANCAEARVSYACEWQVLALGAFSIAGSDGSAACPVSACHPPYSQCKCTDNLGTSYIPMGLDRTHSANL